MTDQPDTTTIQVGTKDDKMKFEFRNRYAEGHALTEIEAKQLNRTLAENISNNIRKTVQATLAGEDDAMNEDELRQYVAEYADAYEFSIASAGASVSSITPVEKAARSMAKTAILAELRRERDMGIRDLDEAGKDWLKSAIIQVSERPAIIKEAEKMVAAQAKITDGILDGLTLTEGDNVDGAEAA